MLKSLYSKLSWDSDTFGYPVVRVDTVPLDENELKTLIQELKKHDIHLAYWFTDPDDFTSNDAAKKNNGLLVDTKVTYTMFLTKKNTIPESDYIHVYEKKHVNKELLILALESGVYSRYKSDPNFRHHEYEKLFEKWIERSVTGEIADQVLVSEQNKTITGLVTIGRKDHTGEIGLLAVDVAYRGQHIGERLMHAAITHLYEEGVHSIKVVTQKANIPACKLYEKLGFRLKTVENVYHFWL